MMQSRRRMLSRRQLGEIVLGAAATAIVPRYFSSAWAATLAESTFGGVPLGLCVGSYRDVTRVSDQQEYIAALASACAASGAGLIEYHNSQLEPDFGLRPRQGEPELSSAEFAARREELRSWRINTPISYFEGVRSMFEEAGTVPFAYSFNFTTDMMDEEIQSVFLHTRALGVEIISTNSTKVEMAARLAPHAEEHQVDLGFHNHDDAEDANEIASLESFEAVMSASERCKANLDVGHFVAANLDPIAFIERNHARITHLHFKDRSRDKGPNVRWGQGETPLAEVLELNRDNGYGIPCLAEYEYHRGPDSETTIIEYQICLEFMRRVLTSDL